MRLPLVPFVCPIDPSLRPTRTWDRVLALVRLAAPLVTRLDVVLSGAGWTSAEAVRRLVSTQPGEPYDATELNRDLARLRGLGILYDVSAHLDGSRVEINATDRWSLLPVLGFRSGGGRTTTQVEVTAHNAFGKLFTLYGQLP